MATCPECGATDLHYDYIELKGLGWRPVWHNADGSRHRCEKRYLAMRDTRPIPVILRGEAQQPKPAPKPQTKPSPQPAAPVSRRRTLETS